MLMIRLMGGMGNQMFQYARGKALEKQGKGPVFYDDSAYEDDDLRSYALQSFRVAITKAPQSEIDKYRRIRRLYYSIRYHVKISTLPSYQHEKKDYKYGRYWNSGYLEGYWQNEKYFLNIREILQKEFVYKGELTDKQKEIIQEMHQGNSVAVHVRRGDYLSEKNRYTYVCLPIIYYQRAISYLQNNIENLRLYIFSDDIPWCKENFLEYENLMYIDESVSNSAQTDFELMRNCKHFIIANSTFSWWPAWLADNEDKTVVAPIQWFFNEKDNRDVRRGLLSENWICIDVPEVYSNQDIKRKKNKNE